MATHTMQIELEGLISLLAQNLYADPDVFLREMIQNAHDSIVKRAEVADERGDRERPQPLIRVVPDAAERTLTIFDNGAGLTEEEIHAYLSTIGRSGTRELRERIEKRDRAQTVSLIGQFGIGLLSAFIVADRVVVTTRAAGGRALRWESAGNKDYRVDDAEREGVGTDVVLHLRPEHSRYLGRDKLEEVIRRYADFIGMPVHVGDEPEPANAVNAPWHRRFGDEKEQRAAYYVYWERRFPKDVARGAAGRRGGAVAGRREPETVPPSAARSLSAVSYQLSAIPWSCVGACHDFPESVPLWPSAVSDQRSARSPWFP